MKRRGGGHISHHIQLNLVLPRRWPGLAVYGTGLGVKRLRGLDPGNLLLPALRLNFRVVASVPSVSNEREKEEEARLCELEVCAC